MGDPVGLPTVDVAGTAVGDAAGHDGVSMAAVLKPLVRRQLRMLPLVGIIFFSVSGGPYGLEDAVSSSGPGMTLVLIMVVPIVFAIPCALMAAELGGALPLEGGYYYWVKLAGGRFLGFLEGAWSWLNSFLDTALYPIVFTDYLAQWVPAVARGHHSLFSCFGGQVQIDTHWAVAVAVMVPLAILNIRGSRLVGDSSMLLVVLVLAPFGVLSVIGVVHLLSHHTWHDFGPFTLPGQHPASAFGAGLGVMIWNYIGWDSPSTVLGEVERPQRTYKLALWISVPLITISYILPMIAALGSGLHSGHPGLWTDGDFANSGGLLAGPWLKLALTIGAMLGNIGLFSALLMSGSRVPRVLAGDGYLPRWVAEDSPRYGTPAKAIIISCLIFAVFCAMNFQALLDADVLTNLASLLLEFVAFLVLRRTLPQLRRPFRVGGGWFGAALVTAGPVAISAYMFYSTLQDEPSAFWVGLAVLAVGVLAYPICRHWAKRTPDADIDCDHVDAGPGVDLAAMLRGERPVRV